jgi:hypothetical protein
MCHREPQYAAWRSSERAGADGLGLDGWQSRVGAIRGRRFASNVTLASFLDCFADLLFFTGFGGGWLEQVAQYLPRFLVAARCGFTQPLKRNDGIFCYSASLRVKHGQHVLAFGIALVGGYGK